MPDKPSGEKEGCIMDMKESLGPAAVFPLGEENEAYAQYFVGTSYLAPLTGADAGVSVSNVTFEPGCRGPRASSSRAMR